MTNVPSQAFSGKVLTVTGAAGGMGLATAVILASRGAAALALADVKVDELQKAQQQITEKYPGTQVTASIVDISKRAQVDDWISSTKEKFGKIHGSANCAGILGGLADIPNVTDEAWDQVLDINLRGTFNCLRAQIPSIVDGGSLVNVSSMAGLSSLPFSSPYCASKHAVIGLTRTAAAENATRGLRVNAVCPGTTDTPMLSVVAQVTGRSLEDNLEAVTARQLLKRAGTAEEVASMIVFLLGDESTYITGEAHHVSGGWNA